MHIFNVTYLKSKIEIKGVLDTHKLNLEIMRKKMKISCLSRCSRQNEMTFKGRKVRVNWKVVGGGK